MDETAFPDTEVQKGLYNGQPVIVKAVRSVISKGVIKEALYWRYLEHPNILPFLGISLDTFEPNFNALVFPLMGDGNILEFLEKKPNTNRFSLVCIKYHSLLR